MKKAQAILTVPEPSKCLQFCNPAARTARNPPPRMLSNYQPTSILEKLDRDFVNIEYSSISQRLTPLPKPTSGHTPILLSMSTSIPKSKLLDLRTPGPGSKIQLFSRLFSQRGAPPILALMLR